MLGARCDEIAPHPDPIDRQQNYVLPADRAGSGEKNPQAISASEPNTKITIAIPVHVIERGKALAFAVIDYGPEHNLIWVSAIDKTGEIWCAPNPMVRMQANGTLGRPQPQVAEDSPPTYLAEDEYEGTGVARLATRSTCPNGQVSANRKFDGAGK